MKIEIVERGGYTAREKLVALIEKKVDRFDKYLSDNASCKVVLSASRGERFKMEVSLSDKGKFIRAEVESDNMYANVDLCLAKVEKQIVKHSEKLIDRKRNADALLDFMFFDDVPEFDTPKIVKRKHYDLAPMSEEEAMEQIELVGHDFYVFLNEKTQMVNVLYKRADEDYGIITTSI